jgi:hypothetical protein
MIAIYFHCRGSISTHAKLGRGSKISHDCIQQAIFAGKESIAVFRRDSMNVRSLERVAIDAFQVPDSQAQIATKMAISRILFGLLIIWRYAYIFGFSVIAADPSIVRGYAALAIFLGVAITLGFLSQVSLLVLSAVFLVRPPFAVTLGDQVALLTAYGLFFTGSNANLAIDALLIDRFKTSSLRHFLRMGAPVPASRNFAKLRMGLIALFWGITFTALSFHFHDHLWMRGGVLQLLFTMPYMSPLYPVFAQIARAAPQLYDVFCRLALLLQCAWELLLLPLMLCKWGRVFVKWQALVFFLVSAFAINLDYLPFAELIFWLMVFNFGASNNQAPAEDDKNPQSGARWVTATAGIAVGIALIYVALIGVFNITTSDSLRNTLYTQVSSTLFRSFGQAPVMVFNRADMSMGLKSYVIFQLSAGGEVLRTVPVLDLNGGRFRYVRNAMLYFDYSVKWQRSRYEAAFSNEEPTKYTMGMLYKFGLLDACLRRATTEQHYAAAFFKREIVEQNPFPIWSGSSLVAVRRFTIDGSILGSTECVQSFSLPPNFYWEDARLRDSLEWARSHLQTQPASALSVPK